MQRRILGIIAGLLLVLAAVPVYANETFQGGCWSVSDTYQFSIGEWGWSNATLELDAAGTQWSTVIDSGDDSWRARFALADADQWQWGADSAPQPAEVSVLELNVGYEHAVRGAFGIGLDARAGLLTGTDIIGDFTLFETNIMAGPVLDKEVKLILGTWLFRGYAMVGPTMQIAETDTYEPYTACGLATRFGAQIGYLLFSTVGVTAGFNQSYTLLPWGAGVGDQISGSRHEFFINGVLRF